MSEYYCAVMYLPLKEGGFQVIAPALSGLASFGRTIEEARTMARDAVACHLKGLLKDGENFPENPFAGQPMSEELKVSI